VGRWSKQKDERKLLQRFAHSAAPPSAIESRKSVVSG
jgi:hypothetical protein